MADPAFLRNIKTQIQDMQNSIPGKQTTYTNAQNTVNTAVNTAKQDATVMATTSADMRVLCPGRAEGLERSRFPGRVKAQDL